jgi:hypothetical protein
MTESQEARTILDLVKDGADVPADVVDYCLRVTGDLHGPL